MTHYLHDSLFTSASNKTPQVTTELVKTTNNYISEGSVDINMELAQLQGYDSHILKSQEKNYVKMCCAYKRSTRSISIGFSFGYDSLQHIKINK